MTPELAAGALLTVDPGRTRLNLLPLRFSNLCVERLHGLDTVVTIA